MDHQSDRPDTPLAVAAALLRSLRDGSAGFVPRLGLSLASAAAGLGALMLVFALVQASARRVGDEDIALGMLVALLGWLGSLYALWFSYSRRRHTIRTVLACVGIVVVAVCICIACASVTRNPEFLIAGTLFLGAAAILGTVTAALHRGLRGRALTAPGGAISVHCPGCRYDMSGLDTTACPECGAKPTLDQLIRAQDYEALRPVQERPARTPHLPAPPRGALPSPSAS